MSKRLNCLLCIIAVLGIAQQVSADTRPAPHFQPLKYLHFRISALEARIAALEAAAANTSVDGRTYCMMTNVTVLRGFTSDGTEIIDTEVVRRLSTFSGGTFTSTLVGAVRNTLSDVGTVEQSAGLAPDLLSGTWAQTGTQIDITFSDGSLAVWYVSRDGSVMHNNAVDFAGPLPNPVDRPAFPRPARKPPVPSGSRPRCIDSRGFRCCRSF